MDFPNYMAVPTFRQQTVTQKVLHKWKQLQSDEEQWTRSRKMESTQLKLVVPQTVYYIAIPVSYTHLDVYKRQTSSISTQIIILKFSEKEKSVQLQAVFFIFKSRYSLLFTLGCPNVLIKGCSFLPVSSSYFCSIHCLPLFIIKLIIPFKSITVSYTHLDVYKRQLNMNSSVTCFLNKVNAQKKLRHVTMTNGDIMR